MTRFQRLCSCALVAALLTACGSAGDEPRPASAPPVEETAFGDMVGTMDRARAVEDVTMQHKKDLDQALLESEGADAH